MELESQAVMIPCIVGTMTATHLLKDGQMVTVDATSGLVYGEVDAWYTSE